MSSTGAATSGDDRETIKFFRFDGDKEEWPEWKMKTRALARKKKFLKAFDIDYSSSSNNTEVEQNDEAYDLLIMSCKKTPFGKNCQTKRRKCLRSMGSIKEKV